MSLRSFQVPTVLCAAVLILTVCVPVALFADSFGIGINAFEIEFVTIADPGNPADTEGFPDPAGSVPYSYRIGKYEISEQMINKANAETAGDPKPLNITIDVRGPDKPATRADWLEAAKFVNWLNTSSGYSPAYKFRTGRPLPNPELDGFSLWEPVDPGYDPANPFRNSLAVYFLPSVDEWYKAAYYDPSASAYFPYPNGSHVPPIAVASGTAPNTAVFMPPILAGPADIMQAGGLSPYGTMAQGGNAFEWNETAFDLLNNDPYAGRIVRGGSWESGSVILGSNLAVSRAPNGSQDARGFRVASIPEPSAFFLMVAALILKGLGRRKR